MAWKERLRLWGTRHMRTQATANRLLPPAKPPITPTLNDPISTSPSLDFRAPVFTHACWHNRISDHDSLSPRICEPKLCASNSPGVGDIFRLGKKMSYSNILLYGISLSCPKIYQRDTPRGIFFRRTKAFSHSEGEGRSHVHDTLLGPSQRGGSRSTWRAARRLPFTSVVGFFRRPIPINRNPK